MMKRVTLLIIIGSFCSIYIKTKKHISDKPRLVVIMVIDQLSYSLLEKTSRYMHGGIRHLLDKGIVYTNAHHANGITATATGHSDLNTGTFAKDHGIVNNSWIDATGLLIQSDDDFDLHRAAVLGVDNIACSYGKSSMQMMIDGFSDQFVLNSSLHHPHYTYSCGLKSRSAILTAGRLGKAIWFDDVTGRFTSSKYYFNEVPAWVEQINDQYPIDSAKEVVWECAKPLCEYQAYNLFLPADAENVPADFCYRNLQGTIIPCYSQRYHYKPFLATPLAQKMIFELGKKCIEEHVCKKNDIHLLLWLNFSGIDEIGHRYGQFNAVTIDMLYHFDRELRCFMRFANRIIGHKNTVFVLTADHGMGLMDVDLKKHGINTDNIGYKTVVNTVNNHIEQRFNVASIIKDYIDGQLYLNHDLLDKLSSEDKELIKKEIKAYLLTIPEIKQVWLADELQHLYFEPYSIEYLIKQQYYKGRSGDVFVLVAPYHELCINKNTQCKGHALPYTYNTHVPLIIYRHNHHELKKIRERVYTIQLANSLAELCHVSQPSASVQPLLPGLFNRKPTLIF